MSNYQGPKSDHFDGRKFFNPGGSTDKSFFQLMKWQLTKEKKEWPEWLDDVQQTIPRPQNNSSDCIVTFINHASLLVQCQGLNIITDPQFSDRTSPVTWAGPKRVRKPGVAFENLPPIDLVVVSHNHYDHLDVPSLRMISKRDKAKILVPLGDKSWLEKEGIKNVSELDWGQSYKLKDAEVIFETAFHWSGRGLNDRFCSLWGAYILKVGGHKIYFAGDTGYSDHFKATQKKHGSFDICFLPIGAYEPRWFMKESHINPAEAVQAHLDLQCKTSIGMHFGTWQLTDEGIDDPEKDLRTEMGIRKLPDQQFHVPKNGQVFNFKLEETF